MTDHPITPPPELVREWAKINGEKDLERFWFHLATQAARWGADMELEACVEWLKGSRGWVTRTTIDNLRAARRPKPPSLADRALQAWHAVKTSTDDQTAMAVIRRALDRLQEFENDG